MPRKLDRSRKFGVTYGDDPRRFYQDGVYFDAQGNECPTPEAPAAAAPPDAPLAPGADQSASVSEAEYREKLAQLNAPQVKSLFKKSGGPEELSKGGGARERMVEWLVQNAGAQAPA